MKKILITALVCVFLMGVAGVAMAAPASIFSDVPANHWAYGAVNKLAKDGVVEGYGDGTYRGDRTMTRYEMAQIIANAMTKEDKASAENKALINKLAKEFAEDLARIDARLVKVEKKAAADKLNWGAEATFRYIQFSDTPRSGTNQTNWRLNASSQINDDTTANFRFINMRQTGWGSTAKDENKIIEGNLKINNFLGMSGVTTTLGRFQEQMGATGYWMNFWGVDGVKVAFGNKLKVEIGAADFSNPSTGYTAAPINYFGTTNRTQLSWADAYWANLKYATSKATSLQAWYLKNNGGALTSSTGGTSTVAASDVELWGAGLSTRFAKNFLLRGDYVKNTAYDADNTAAFVRLNYKGADFAKPHTWGLGVAWVKAEKNASIGWGDYNTTSLCPTSNVEEYEVVFDYTMAKNLKLFIGQAFNAKDPQTGAHYAMPGAPVGGNWSRVQVAWLF